jgi:uncharacterized protein YdeI (YjbR/CyaY-like superfamily)
MTDAPTFFETPEDFRAWLNANHDQEQVLLVGFYKVGSGKPSITWEQSVEEALCFGWIDGVRRRIDDKAYTIRFTPRRPGSHWSQKNIDSVQRLIAAGPMQPAGLAAYQARSAEKSARASYEQDKTPELSPELLAHTEQQAEAWAFFQAQPPGYRRTMLHWVTSAKQEQTRLRRLDRILEVSAQGTRVDLMKPFG